MMNSHELGLARAHVSSPPWRVASPEPATEPAGSSATTNVARSAAAASIDGTECATASRSSAWSSTNERCAVVTAVDVIASSAARWDADTKPLAAAIPQAVAEEDTSNATSHPTAAAARSGRPTVNASTASRT